MKCEANCANEAEYRFHRHGQVPKNLCSPHKFVATSTVEEGTFTIQPLTLEGHQEDYKVSTGARRIAYYSCSADVRLS